MACYVNNPQSSTKKWFGLFVKVAILAIVMVARVNSEDQTGLLCINDCATCPVICSPPPPPLKSHAPWPPPPHSSPPPPLTPIYQSPPQSHHHSPPPPPPPVPSSNIPWIVVPTPPSSSNSPSNSGHAPPTAGPRDGSTYPYYYFYASKGTDLCIPTSILVVMLLFHVAYIF